MGAEKPESEKKASGMDNYQTVAETVGMVPSLNAKDNLYQGVFCLAVTLLAALLGWIGFGGTGAGVGAIIGLIGSFLVSGIILMIVGWVRAAKRLKK